MDGITVDFGGVVRGLREFLGKGLEVELAKAEKEISNRLLNEARNDHEYRSRTGNLKAATKISGSVTGGGLKLFVDTSKAPYAKMVIQGKGTWDGDPFLDKALEDNQEWIIARLQKAIDAAVTTYNRKS